MRSHLGVPVTAGALSQGAQSTGTDLVPVHKEIVARLNDADMVVMDEGGWRRRVQPGLPGGHIAAHRVVIHAAQLGGRAIRARQVERLEYVH
ncbi:MAG: hypothetical protein M0040_05255, partial [Actinomycetota bacterium]|nr:hypothetical protein [Actinomycetota bacterium]